MDWISFTGMGIRDIWSDDDDDDDDDDDVVRVNPIDIIVGLCGGLRIMGARGDLSIISRVLELERNANGLNGLPFDWLS